jgi:hypothetical protein
MASSGYDITKDIVSYSEELTQITKDYTDSIGITKTNIAKLEAIKTEVSAIIVAAQGRRDAKLIEILNAESTRNGTPLLTEADYKTKYASCLDEENIQVYDVDEITGVHTDPERCFNNLDDDLDGLIDSKDPDCNGVVPIVRPNTTTTENTVYHCEIDGTFNTIESFDQTVECQSRGTESECFEEPYYPNNFGGGGSGASYSTCKWVAGPAGNEPNPYDQNNPNSTSPVCMLDNSKDPGNFIPDGYRPYAQEQILCSNRNSQTCTAMSYVDSNRIYEYSCVMGAPSSLTDVSIYGCTADLGGVPLSNTPWNNTSCFARTESECTSYDFIPNSSTYKYKCKFVQP